MPGTLRALASGGELGEFFRTTSEQITVNLRVLRCRWQAIDLPVRAAARDQHETRPAAQFFEFAEREQPVRLPSGLHLAIRSSSRNLLLG